MLNAEGEMQIYWCLNADVFHFALDCNSTELSLSLFGLVFPRAQCLDPKRGRIVVNILIFMFVSWLNRCRELENRQ